MIESGFHNADCMKHMKEYPDNYFDLAIVDPQYANRFIRQFILEPR